MKVVERVRHQTPLESGRQEKERLRLQLRRMSERNAVAFDQGFAAAVRMVEAGADLERLRAASGVVAADFEDTSPMERDISLDETGIQTQVWDVDEVTNVETMVL